MWIKTPTGKPTERKEGNQKIDSIIQNPIKEIAGVLDNDTKETKKTAREIKLKGWTTFDEAVNLLMRRKAEGKNCFINFNWTKIYSVTTKDIDDAYFQYMWMTKAESKERDRRFREEFKASERERKKREEWYVKKIEDSREGKESIIITKDAVVAGLKFIAEHPDMKQDELINKLISLGCNFTFEDIIQQFPECENTSLFSGMRDGDLSCGASVIANVMQSEFSRSYCDDRFLSWDYENSIYAFIRKVTGDETYTKEYVDSLVKKEK